MYYIKAIFILLLALFGVNLIVTAKVGKTIKEYMGYTSYGKLRTHALVESYSPISQLSNCVDISSSKHAEPILHVLFVRGP